MISSGESAGWERIFAVGRATQRQLLCAERAEPLSGSHFASHEQTHRVRPHLEMQFDALKDKIKEISLIAAAQPEEFRQKCFELLMSHLLGAPTPPSTANPFPSGWNSASPLPVASLGYSGAPPMTALLAAFVKKIGLSNERFGRVVGYLHGNVVFFREPGADKAAQTQIEWAMLLALKNAIVKGAFSIDAEEVRLVCQEKGIFDRRNFYTTFRRHGDYFRSPPEPNGRAQPLSSKGLAALGALIKSLAENTKSPSTV